MATGEGREHFTFDGTATIARFIQGKVKCRPCIGVICGSGLGFLADSLEEKEVLGFQEIPGFPRSTVAGHKGRLVFGVLRGVPVVCMQGRFHVYEGHPPWKVGLPIRVMKQLGVKAVVTSNAVGGVNPSYAVGDIMVVKDHINIPGIAGANPLVGSNDDRFGARFTSLANAYDRRLRTVALEAADALGFRGFFREGVLAVVSGPAYESPAEIRMFRMLGADAVGMSVINESLVARHCGLPLLALSLITNKCVDGYGEEEGEPSHEEVLEAARAREGDVATFVGALVVALVGRLEEGRVA